MIQGTTPAILLEVPDYDLTDKTVIVAVKGMNGKGIEKAGDSLTVTYSEDDAVSTIAFQLTQAETLALNAGYVQLQVRFIDEDGTAEATEIRTAKVGPVLNPREIAYGEG